MLESDGRGQPRVGGVVVVRIAVVVHIAEVGRVAGVRGQLPPVGTALLYSYRPDGGQWG
nr:MAG TPA: hypothetical protein [Bacteriophage sp.]